MSSFRTALTEMSPPAEFAPSSAAVTLSAIERTSTAPPAPTTPAATWPRNCETWMESFAVTPMSWPATMLAPEWMTAEVPGGTGALFSSVLMLDCVGACALMPLLADCAPEFTWLVLVLALPLPSLLKLPRPWVTTPVPACDCWAALLSGSPLSLWTPLALLPLLSLYVLFSVVPTDQTLTEAPAPTKPPAPLIV